MPFLDRLGHKTRRRMCPLYVAGLIGPGDRKSVQPMAERLATGNYDQLHHFIADSVWDATPLETELLNQANRLVGGTDAVLVIDDTSSRPTCMVGSRRWLGGCVRFSFRCNLGTNAVAGAIFQLALRGLPLWSWRDHSRGSPVGLALRIGCNLSWDQLSCSQRHKGREGKARRIVVERPNSPPS